MPHQRNVIGVVVATILVLVAAAPQPSFGEPIEEHIRQWIREIKVSAIEKCRDVPLKELEARKGELRKLVVHRIGVLKKMVAEMRLADAERRAPNPKLLDADATATGYRSKQYYTYPKWKRDLIDEFEVSMRDNIFEAEMLAWGFLKGAGSWNMTAEEGVYWEHYRVEVRRLARFTALVLRDEQTISICIDHNKTRAARLRSGEYNVEVTSGGTVFPSKWKLIVTGTKISGVSEWQCCPGRRVDQLDGQVDGEKVEISRDCRGQGGTGACHQVYTGRMGVEAIQGTFHGTQSGTWKLHLK